MLWENYKGWNWQEAVSNTYRSPYFQIEDTKSIARDEAYKTANNILKDFFERITDENLKVDVGALQEYIDDFVKNNGAIK